MPITKFHIKTNKIIRNEKINVWWSIRVCFLKNTKKYLMINTCPSDWFSIISIFILCASNVWRSIKVCFLFVSYTTSFWLISFTEFPIFPLDVSYNIFAFIPKPLWLIFWVWIHNNIQDNHAILAAQVQSLK